MKGDPNTYYSHLSKELLLALVAKLPTAAFVIDDERIYCNHAAEKLTGYSNNEVATFTEWLQKIMEPVHGSLRELYEQDKAAGFPSPRDFLITCRDGSHRTVEFTAAGRDQVYCVMHDVTERTRAQQKLKDSEALLREAQRVGNMGVFDYDNVADCWTSSREMDTIFGIDASYPKTFSSWLDIIHPESRDEMAEYFKVILAAVRWFDMEYRIIRPCDGLERWVYGTGEFICDAAGSPIRMIGTIQDVTDRKAAEAETTALNQHLEELVAERTASLEKSNAELAGFSYAISHELRAPITRIQGFSAILGEVCKGSDETAFMASRIEHASRELQAVVDSILMLSRLSLMELVLQSVELSGMAARKLEKLLAENPERTVEAVVMPGIEAVADPGLMNLCLDNLVNNAFKYTSQTPAACIEFGLLDTAGKKVYFVRDNGAGFDMTYAEKLYAPFQRLHQHREFPGSGIGLATVKRIINRHGGEVWAEARVGQGATFYFTLGGGS